MLTCKKTPQKQKGKMPTAFSKKRKLLFFLLKSHRLIKKQAKNEKLKYFLALFLSATTKPEALKPPKCQCQCLKQPSPQQSSVSIVKRNI